MNISPRIAVALLTWLVLSSAPACAAGILPSVRSRLPERSVERPAGVPDDAALEAGGAVIGEVRFVRLNVFDPRIAEEDIPLFRFVNRLHVLTRAGTLEAQLLFRPGDPYAAGVLRETERRLRANGYLADARIRPVAYANGKVDLEVLTQDTWTLKPDVHFGRAGGKNSSGIGLTEQNLLGTGALLSFTSSTDVDRRTRILEYANPNLNADHWQLDAQVADNSDGHAQLLSVERPFYALDSRWATGIAIRNETRIDSIYDLGRITESYRTHERAATAYAGWSAGLRNGWVTRWTGGLTSDERRAGNLDDARPAPRLPVDRRLVYPWVGWELLEDDYREVRNLDQIGRVEDLALGWDLKVRLGAAAQAFGSDRDALVFAAGATKGVRPSDEHTWLWRAGASGRVERGSLSDSIFSGSVRYYWRQSARRTLFIGLGVDRGVHLDVDKQLTLGGDNGLRGYPLRYRTGQGRWLLTVEERLFTEWYPYRLFALGGAVFYDAGGVWGRSLVPVSPPPTQPTRRVLQDIGFGLRLGNTRSALGNVVHVDVAHPLDGDPSIRKVQVIIEAKRSF